MLEDYVKCTLKNLVATLYRTILIKNFLLISITFFLVIYDMTHAELSIYMICIHLERNKFEQKTFGNCKKLLKVLH